MKKIINRMGLIPNYYGVAYIRQDHCDAVCYPIPINLIIRYLYALWIMCKNPPLFEKRFTGWTKARLQDIER